MIEYRCPHCERVLKIPDEYLGKSGKCNHCGGKIVVRITAAFPKHGRDTSPNTRQTPET